VAIIHKYIDRWKAELSGLYHARELQHMWRVLSREEVIPPMDEVIDRLKQREPFDYILGHSIFFGLPFRVDRSVLIPRPETEELVAWILEDCANEYTRVLDIGTGSGCIAIALASHRPAWDVTAIDVSGEALALARQNALLNEVRVSFAAMDILADRPAGHFDIIVSNPPYITSDEKHLLTAGTRQFEPEVALFAGGTDPLVFYRRIAAISRDILNANGRLYFELNEFHAEAIRKMTGEYGLESILRADLQGKPRMLQAVFQ
jgi:release factor glutamine methyltransferase